jgi:hypothetical protein
VRASRSVSKRHLVATRASRIVAVAAVALGSLGPAAIPTVAAETPTIETAPLLGGHVRVGAWLAIAVHLTNDGPAVSGELRLSGGSQGQTRFSTPVDLPTGSDKTYTVYVQPPAFGSQIGIALVDGDETIVSTKPKYAAHDGNQLIVGVIAEHPEAIIGSLHLLPDQNQAVPVVVGLSPEQLPERVEALQTLDRLVWQDVDSSRLTPAQSAALQGWVAGGGRLVIVGGTAGPKTLAGFSDAMLPYRPETTIDVPPASLVGILGGIPDTATTLPGLSGALAGGRTLASVGDRTVAAERSYGSGLVTLLGFDPSVDWIARTDTADALWRRLLPARSSSDLTFSDDSMMVQAVSQLPSLALPPINGLIALLGAYILLIGPINYLVLRRLDKREWAWFTMPALIVVFAVGAYAIGSALRGSELIVNEVAIARGSPGTTEGTAQIYLGIFSPTRGTYQVDVPGGALLSPPTSGDVFGTGTGQLDIVQGDPSRVRDLAVGFGSLRTIRAQTAVSVPQIDTDLRLVDGHLTGTLTNQSTVSLERPAVVLGTSVQVLDDLAPGATAEVDVRLSPDPFGMQLSDRVVGQLFFDDRGLDADSSTLVVRHTMVDQLSYDPMFGMQTSLPADGPVVLAWGSPDLLPVQIEGQTARHLGNVLYYIPTDFSIAGQTTFRSDLIRSTVVDSDAAFFSQDPYSINFGRGSATIAYQPVGFEGTLDVTELAIGLNFGGDTQIGNEPKPIKPLPTIPPPCATDATGQPDGACAAAQFDGLPEVELFDLKAQEWVRLPHLDQSERYAVLDPARYVDPTSATALVRFVNDISDGVGFSVDVAISGDVHD